MKSLELVVAEREFTLRHTSDDCAEQPRMEEISSYGPYGLHPHAGSLGNTEREACQDLGDYLVALATLCHHSPANHGLCFKRTEDRFLERE